MYDWLDDALLDDSSEIVTANRRLARTLIDEYGRRQRQAGRVAWRSPQIHAYRDWLSRLGAQLVEGRLPTHIQLAQCRVLWERCLRSDLRDPFLNIGSLARQCLDTWQRMHEWSVRLADAEATANGQDQRIFARAAGRYAAILDERAWIDDAQLPDLLAAHAAALPKRQVLLAGFDRVTPQLQGLIDALTSAGNRVEHAALKRPAVPELRRYENADAELRSAGAWARSVFDDDPDKRVAIVVTNLDRGAERTSRLIEEGFAPGWQQARDVNAHLINVSYGRRLVDYPAIRVGVLALRWLCEPLTGVDVSVLLRSPFLGSAQPFERSEFELRLRDWPDRHWSRGLLTSAMAHYAKADASDWLNRWLDVEQRFPGIDDKLKPSAWAEQLDGVLELLNWPGEQALGSADYQLVNRWRNLLNEFARLETVSAEMSGDEAISRLATMAADTVFQPEAPGSVIDVLGPLEAAGLEFDALWVTGMTADEWPPASRPLPLLSRELQRERRMPDSTPGDTADYAMRVIRRVRSSAETCILSLPANLGDAEQLPSALLADRPVVDFGDDPGWYATGLAKAQCETIEDRVPALGRSETVRGGASTLRRQAHDPFSAFAYGRLGIRWLQAFRPGIPANLRGSLVHDALQSLYQGMPSQREILDWGNSALSKRIDAAVRDSFKRHERNADRVLKRLLQIERERTASLLLGVVEADIARPAFSIESVETQIETRIEDVPLSLRCDRVDRLPSGELIILDYKTGVPRKFLVGGEPRDPQLVVYACALDEPIAALGLYNVDASLVAIDGAGPALSDADELPWPEVLESWRRDVARLASGLARGDVRLNAHQGSREARPLNVLSRFTEISRER